MFVLGYLTVLLMGALKECGSRGINFCCTSFRLKGGSGRNGIQSGSIADCSKGLDGGLVVSVSRLVNSCSRLKSLCAAVVS